MMANSLGAMVNKVDYIVYEGTMSRMERTIRRLWILVLVLIVLLFGSNALWLYEWCQYDYVDEIETTYTQDGSGINMIGDGNEVDYGANSKEK